MLEGDGGDDEGFEGVGGQLGLRGHALVKRVGGDGEVVVGLFKREAELDAGFDRRRDVGRVHGEHDVAATLFRPQDLEGVALVAGRDDAVADLGLDEAGEGFVNRFGDGDEVAEAGDAVAAAGPGVGGGGGAVVAVFVKEGAAEVVGQFARDRGPGGADVLETGGGGLAGGGFEVAHQLPGADGVERVDVGRGAVDHGERAVAQGAGAGGGDFGVGLVGIATVFKFDVGHGGSLTGGLEGMGFRVWVGGAAG